MNSSNQMRSALFCILVLIIFSLSAQERSPTIGEVFTNENVTEGYTLFTPENNTDVYLVNNCGGVVNQWTFPDQPNRTAYLLENGNLLRAGKSFIEIKTWEDELIWSYDLEASGLGQHHDIEPMPNGNVLCIMYDRYTKDEMVAAGRLASITDVEFQLDKIVELKPIGTTSAEVVWEWKMFDHLVQDQDQSKANYGSVADQFRRFNINFDNGETSNFCHVNGIDYNPELDQILFSARNLSEIYIIDHSTTREEAATSLGGNIGYGGDLLWRWGNPVVYNQGTAIDQILFSQHDPKWIPSGYQDQGKITVFNNNPTGEREKRSSLEMLAPVIEQNEYQMLSNTFLPATQFWSWSGEILGTTMIESRKSGFHALPNGNLIICETARARISEMTKEGKTIWAYVNPTGPNIYEQYDTIRAVNGIFRGEKYPTSFPAFDNRILESQGFLENENPISETCGEHTRPPAELVLAGQLLTAKLWVQNPIRNGEIIIGGDTQSITSIQVVDLSGQLFYDSDSVDAISHLSLNSGVYILRMISKGKPKTLRLVLP